MLELSMNRKVLAHSSTLALLTLGLVACGGSGSGGGDEGIATGTINVSVTDAAVDSAEQVLVQFTGVTVKPSEGEAQAIPLSGDSQTCQDYLDGRDPSPTQVGEPTIRCIELKELQGTNTADLLKDVVLTAGNYSWMRLDVDAKKGVMDSIIAVNTGDVYSLYVPSGSQSGLKLNSGFTILAGGSHKFVIDFDLRKSVNNPQGFEDYRLKPSLRMIDLAASGNIVGAVDPSRLTANGCTGNVNTGDGFAVYVYDTGADIGEEGSSSAPLTSASVNWNADSNQWDYTVGFLAPGEYTVAFTCQAAEDSAEVSDNGTFLTESPDSPTIVVANQDSVVNFP
jgi:hypothetical protein